MEFLRVSFPGWKAPDGIVKPTTDRQIADAIQQKEIVFYFDVTYKPSELEVFSMLSENGTPKIVFLPSLNGASESSSIYGRSMVAINNASPNKRNAYEFLKLLLSFEVQKNELMIPVHNDALRAQLSSAVVSSGLAQDAVEPMLQDLKELQYRHPVSTEQYKLVERAMRP